jgi:hypothetical protein
VSDRQGRGLTHPAQMPYGFDVHKRSRLKTPRRIYYVTSMLHFARLRWAVVQELGV